MSTRRRAQDAVAQVEHALVTRQRSVPHVERFVVDQQPHELPVGDVDERLSLLGIAVARLGMWHRYRLEEPGEVRPGDRVGFPLVEVAAEADVPVRQRKDRFGLREEIAPESRLRHRPWRREQLLIDHDDPNRSCGSRTMTVAISFDADLFQAKTTPVFPVYCAVAVNPCHRSACCRVMNRRLNVDSRRTTRACMPNLRAAIFDVDGVLVDSPHEKAWRESLRELMQDEWRGISNAPPGRLRRSRRRCTRPRYPASLG